MVKSYQLPFENIITLRHSGIVKLENLMSNTKDLINDGICLFLKESHSTELEGGYLFSFIKNGQDLIEIYSINKRKMTSFNNYEDLTGFINHHSGRKFDEEQWLLSQKLNFLLFNEEISPH